MEARVAFVAVVALLAAAGSAAGNTQPKLLSEGDNLEIQISAGKSFMVTCPTDCSGTVDGVACEGDDVEVVDGKCQPKAGSDFSASRAATWNTWSVEDDDWVPTSDGSKPTAVVLTAKKIRVSGFNLYHYLLPWATDTFACRFYDPGSNEMLAETDGVVVEDSASGHHGVLCNNPMFRAPVMTRLELWFVAEEPAFQIPFKGRGQRDRIAFKQYWVEALAEQTDSKLQISVRGNGFVADQSYTLSVTPEGSTVPVSLTALASSWHHISFIWQYNSQGQPSQGSILSITVNTLSASEYIGTAASNKVTLDTCEDTLKNFGESDTDCGGNNCIECGHAQSCSVTSDCVQGLKCYSGTCHAATCKQLQVQLTNPTNGPYTLHDEVGPMSAYCDFTTDGGGWTLLTKIAQLSDTGSMVDEAPFNNNGELWTKGGGNHLPQPTDLFAKSARYCATLDWRRFFKSTGTDYHLRQALWLGSNKDPRINYEDVYYTVKYPGFVSQDDVANPAVATDLVWPASNPVYLTNPNTNANKNGPFGFYPPWTTAPADKLRVSGCHGFVSGMGGGDCRDTHLGSAGFVRTGAERHGSDPPGSPWFPHRPIAQTCIVWGRHQGQVWCIDGGEQHGAYFFREI